MLLQGRCAIVTGGSRGLGAAIVKAFVENGCSVVTCAREAEVLSALINETAVDETTKARLFTMRADVSSPNDVQSLVQSAKSRFGKIDIVVNNAGILGPTGPCESLDWQSWSQTFEINLCGPVLLCRAVIPMFKEQRHGRIINISGGGAANPRAQFSAYAASKAALVRLTETLAEELADFGVTANAIAPGAFLSRMTEELLAAGEERVGEKAYRQALALKSGEGGSKEKAANLCVFLASDEASFINGRLLSAVFDPWQELGRFKEQLVKSDVYTLRRIVPADRGFGWE